MFDMIQRLSPGILSTFSHNGRLWASLISDGERAICNDHTLHRLFGIDKNYLLTLVPLYRITIACFHCVYIRHTFLNAF